MSIVPLSHLTLVGRSVDRDQLLVQLQTLGCTHIHGLESGHPAQEPSPSQAAMNFLLSSPAQRHQVLDEPEFDCPQLVQRVLDCRDRLTALRERLDFLRNRIHSLEAWGNFQLPAVAELDGHRFWFYQVPRYKFEEVRRSELCWAVVNRDERFAYVVVVAREEPEPHRMPVPRIHIGSESLEQLIRQREQLEVALDECRIERYNYTQWIRWLLRHMSDTRDTEERRRAAVLCREYDGFFVLTGWVPTRCETQLRAFAEQQGCVVLLEAVAEEDNVPTLLSNPANLVGGEELVAFYQMPGYRSWDPSRVLFFSFAAFFAMILADAGYALLLGVGLAAGWRRLSLSEAGSRLRMLMAAIVVASVLYGTLCGSVFGLTPQWLQPVQLLDVTNYDQMIGVAVAIGFLHVLLANLITVWHWWGSARSRMHLGWVLVLLGCASLWFSGRLMSAADQLTPESGLLLVGLALVTWNANPRTVTGWRSALARIATGLVEVANLSKIFGDVLSYLRLFALGLASASLAMTFNQLAADLHQQWPLWGGVLAVMVLLIGHALNLVLALVSGLVHGLRLNFIEFYHWSLSDEGYPFRPFKKQEIEPWTPS